MGKESDKTVPNAVQESPLPFPDGSDLADVKFAESFYSDDFFRAHVRRDPLSLRHIPLQFRTPSLCLEAVQRNGKALMYVPEATQNPAICTAAIKSDPLVFAWVRKQSDEIALLAVERHPPNLRLVEHQTAMICLAAVKRDAWAILDVRPELLSEEICLAAVRQDGLTLLSIPENLWTERVRLTAVTRNGLMLAHLPSPTLEECRVAVRQNGKALHMVPDDLMSQDICLQAVQSNGWSLRHVPQCFADQEVIRAAVRQNGLVLRIVSRQDSDICNAAIRSAPDAADYVRIPWFRESFICPGSVQGLPGSSPTRMDG